MLPTFLTAAVAAAAAGAGAATVAVARRYGHRLLERDPHPSLEGYGFHLREEASRARVAAIIEAFFTGYNTALAGHHPAAIRSRCEALPQLVHPFAFEGTGMGRAARRLLRPRLGLGSFEEFIEAVHPGYRFMFYVGLGVWSGFRGAGYARRAVAAIGERKYGGLVYDGFGFQRGFFHRPRRADAHLRLERLPEEALAHAYQGFGRSLWFVFRDDPEGLQAALDALPGAARGAALTGVGLAATFTATDRLEMTLERLDRVPAVDRPALERGLRLALFVRDMPGDGFLGRAIASCSAPAVRVLNAHLEHARAAYARTIDKPSFLAEFTAAC